MGLLDAIIWAAGTLWIICTMVFVWLLYAGVEPRSTWPVGLGAWVAIGAIWIGAQFVRRRTGGHK